ncbi:MAG: HAMP domain-containing histidine kinase [Oscillospiraceae bacterium]|nr:HAMP domain-containing histidine kinase [Oscillospiraceae bacterium]
MSSKSKKRNPFWIVNRLGMKLTILSSIIILAADILAFTAAIVVGFLMGGTNSTTQVVGTVIASIIIGMLLSFIIGNTVLKPLSELVKATKKVANGDFNTTLPIGWTEKHTVTELRELIMDFNEMTEELRNTEIFRNDFISNFSHEFKTPLVSIRGFARQLCEGDLTPEQQREFSKIILDETEFLSVLSQNTLLLTGLENKDIISDKTLFSLDEQLRDCMIRLEPQWSEKDLEIEMDLDKISFFWNESMLSHVWNNLFDNAVKFVPNGGKITVSCKPDGEIITVSVTDSGCGIPENAIPHIFEKFYQADSSHATKGNGLGLPLVKKIVELCGGKICVESTVGVGTAFTVTLPNNRG